MATLHLRGAREHNLKSVDLDLPLGRWIAVTGPSGSGKTSLVFDTLVREGQRRFLGSLSPRARHYFGKLGRADVDALTHLPPVIAIGQQSLGAHARSTVGTLTGTLDLLRLLFARTAVDPGGAALTRSHFSFNHPDGACEACQGLGLEDRVDPALLVADASKSLRDGALTPTLKNGYTVYSQVTLDVMDTICRAHGFDVHTPWATLTQEQRDVILYGTQALKVPFGKHSIESRMKWEGITARPREEGYYRGLIPVIEETLLRNRNPNILRFVQSAPCSVCDGSRLGRPGREAQVGAFTLPRLLHLPATELAARLDELPASPVYAALRPSLEPRLRRMLRLELGHLSLERSSTTLSGGEAQRLRLASQLTSELGGMLVALDEPTLGLHPSGQAGMRAVLDELRALGNTLVVVEHDPDMVRSAEHLVELGPGAGSEGGRVVFEGPLPEHPLGCPPPAKPHRRAGSGELVLRGAALHNLRRATLRVRLGAFNAVMGPSGAGKSSLVFGTLLPALRGEPGGSFEALERPETAAPSGRSASPQLAQVAAVDARPIGRTPRSTPATWSGLFDVVRKRFAALPAARELGLGPGHFSYNNKEGRCATCEGLGFQRIGLHLVEDVELPCADCAGGRYAPAPLAVTWNELTVAQVLALTVREALAFFATEPALLALCRAMDDLGLGYLPLGHPSSRLSRGEAQRIKLATLLGSTSAQPALLLLDEPDRGLHPSDVELLLRAIDQLVDVGHTVLAISHHRHLWSAADALTHVEDGVAAVAAPPDTAPLSRVRPPEDAAALPDAIELDGVRTHTLKGIDVRIPHGALTAIAGVSGSGKTSLAFDTLASEAWHRFSESLPFQVRRFVRRLPRPDLDAARGLLPTLSLRQDRARSGRRSTVATQSEIGPLLRLLWSRLGAAPAGPYSAEHFSPDRPLGACPACDGLGFRMRCDPDRLVTNASRSLAGGALDGTRPGKFFGEPDGQYLATLQAAANAALGPGEAGVLTTPWNELDASARQLALDGSGAATYAVSWSFTRGKRSGEHRFEGTWDGFCALVEREARRRAASKQAAEWALPLIETPCRACGGARLRPEVAAVVVGDHTLAELQALPLDEARQALAALEFEPGRAALLDALRPDLLARLDDLCDLGLGHLTLARRSRTLSGGELQRVRLASVLRSGLTGMTLVLDEPSAGLHARDIERLLGLLVRLRDAGNTIVVVAHRPQVLRAADHLLELGPGPGERGGELLASGAPADVLAGDGPTATALRALAGRRRSRPHRTSQPTELLRIRGARAHNLKSLDVELPASGFVCVTGVSGSGKSSLVFDVIEASLRARAPIECTSLEIPGGFERFQSVATSRSLTGAGTPLAALDLMPPLQQLFHAAASDTGLKRQAFSFLSPAGRCEACRGSGREDVAMDFLADLALPCEACGGRRYRPEVLTVQWKARDVSEFLATPASSLLPELRDDASKPAGKLAAGLEALEQLGLGYLALGRPRAELSGGEAQRLTLAASLLHGKAPSVYLLDEPATGLHESDVERMASVLQSFAARGDLLIAAEHRRSLIATADWVIELGPESGSRGGQLVAQGAP